MSDLGLKDAGPNRATKTTSNRRRIKLDVTNRNRVKEVERIDPNRAIVKPGQSPGTEIAETDPNRVTEHEKIVPNRGTEIAKTDRNRERKVAVTDQNQKKNHVVIKVAVNDPNRVTEIAAQKRKPRKQNPMKKVGALVLTNAYPTGGKSLTTSLKVKMVPDIKDRETLRSPYL